MIFWAANNKIPQTRYLIINNRDLLPTVLGIQDQGLGSGEVLVSGTFLLCHHLAEEEREFPPASLMKALMPFSRAPPSGLNLLSEAPPQSATISGIRFSNMNFEAT